MFVYMIKGKSCLHVTIIDDVPSRANGLHGVTRFLRNIDNHIYAPFDL